MSRIGKQPVVIPPGIEITLKDGVLSVKGSKGTLKFKPHKLMKITVADALVTVERSGNEILERSLHGLTRTLIANMIQGVSAGFSKQLEILGVGYKVQLQGNKLQFALGYSHPVDFVAPEGIKFEIDKEKKNLITISGVDKQLVGQVSANIRALRKPEPYKGKGIRYVGEYVRRKAGKAATVAAKPGG